jgi:hypothetical protein
MLLVKRLLVKMKRLSETHKSNIAKSRKNKIWVNNGNKNLLIDENFFIQYKSAGWLRGRKKINKFWITNGLVNILINENDFKEKYTQLGFWKGRKI